MALVITPGEFGSFVASVNAAVLQTLDDMITQSVSEARIDAFSAWVNGVWGPFYRANESTWETITGSAFASTMEQAEALRQQYLGYRADFEANGGRSTAPAPVPPVRGPDVVGGVEKLLKPVIVGAIVLGGVYLLVKLLSERSTSRI